MATSFLSLLSKHTVNHTHSLGGHTPYALCRRGILNSVPQYEKFYDAPQGPRPRRSKKGRYQRGRPLPDRMRAGQNSSKTMTSRTVGVLDQPNRALYLSEDQSSGSVKLPEREFLTMFEGADVVREGSEVRNFSEQTLRWIIGSTTSHMNSHGESYGFSTDDMKVLTGGPDANVLVSSTEQNTSQWLILHMLRQHNFVHSFTSNPDFEPLRNLFKMSNKVEPVSSSDGILTMRDDVHEDTRNNLCIEKADLFELDSPWMMNRGYYEFFDVIFDESALDMVKMKNYVETTIYGHCLRTGGVAYVSAERISGDIAGRKLRSKVSALYPNSHFQLVAERDTAWNTQFVFLKALSCSQENVHRAADRADNWGDGHLQYAQSAIWNRSKVRDNAGRDMCEGVERITDAFETNANPHHQRKPQEQPYFSSFV